MRRLLLTAGAAAAAFAAGSPALAQYYGDGYGPPRRYERPYDGGSYGGPPRGPRIMRVCVTSRGACPSYPLPQGSPCRCEIPGFGPKRGVVGG